MSGGVLVRVVFVQMVFVRGGFCPTPPPAIYPFHTSLFIHSLKQDKGSRLPTLDMSLTSESINQSIITISQP